jgi:hypothetical protein
VGTIFAHELNIASFVGHVVLEYENVVCTTYFTCSTCCTGCMAMLAHTRLNNDAGVDKPLTGRLLCFLAEGSGPALSGDSGITAGYVQIRALHEPATVRIVAKLGSERRLRKGRRFRRVAGSPFIRLGSHHSMSPLLPRIAFFSVASQRPLQRDSYWIAQAIRWKITMMILPR